MSTNAGNSFFSEVMKVVKLTLVMQATNLVSERSFSTLHKLNGCIQQRVILGWTGVYMIIYIHKELRKNDALWPISVANQLTFAMTFRCVHMNNSINHPNMNAMQCITCTCTCNMTFLYMSIYLFIIL